MDEMFAIASVIGNNLLGYDLIIFAAAAVTLYCYITSRRLAEKLYKTLNVTIFLPEQALKKTKLNAATISEADLVDMRKRTNVFYLVFINLTGIFPLLGILGTVVALIPMVSDMDNVRQSFFTALTSTFWGLVFAIVFKFLDGFLAARMEENASNTALYLERNRIRSEEAECETEV